MEKSLEEQLFVPGSVADEMFETGQRIRAASEFVLDGTKPFTALGRKESDEGCKEPERPRHNVLPWRFVVRPPVRKRRTGGRG